MTTRLTLRSTLLSSLTLLTVFAIGGCDDGSAPSTAKQTARGEPAPAGAKVDGSDASGPANAEGAETKPAGAAPRECCKYCLSGVPDGDDCVAKAKAGSTPKPGCACPGDQRTPPKFKEGQRVGALIAADVYAYNKAQGDPIDGPFTLDLAFEGDADLADRGKGELIATFVTDLGEFECVLFEEQTPLTVANFVGLARGTRPVFEKKDKAWVKRPYYDGIVFHRVIPNFMIQTGDPLGSGTGGPGYFIVDEFDPTLRHSSPGILSMANRNQVDPRTQKLRFDPKSDQQIGNTGSSQFFVTVAKTPHLDDRHTVFGKCANAKVPTAISKVPTKNMPEFGVQDRPVEDVHLKTVKISRRPK